MLMRNSMTHRGVEQLVKQYWRNNCYDQILLRSYFAPLLYTEVLSNHFSVILLLQHDTVERNNYQVDHFILIMSSKVKHLVVNNSASFIQLIFFQIYAFPTYFFRTFPAIGFYQKICLWKLVNFIILYFHGEWWPDKQMNGGLREQKTIHNILSQILA